MTHNESEEGATEVTGPLKSTPYLIDCIGMDYILHLCEPHKDTAICGMKVRAKKVSPNDVVNYFSCYECTF